MAYNDAAEEAAAREALLEILRTMQGDELARLEEAFAKEFRIQDAELNEIKRKRLEFEAELARQKASASKNRFETAKQEFHALRKEIDGLLERVLAHNRTLMNSLRDVFADLTTQYRLTAKAESDLDLVRRRFQRAADDVVARTNHVRELAKNIGDQAALTLGREILQGLESDIAQELAQRAHPNRWPNMGNPSFQSFSPHFGIPHLSWLATGFIATAMSMHVTQYFLSYFFGAHSMDSPFGLSNHCRCCNRRPSRAWPHGDRWRGPYRR